MKNYKGNNKQIAVLGLGHFGQSILRTLSENGYEVLGCDNNPVNVHEASAYATHVVQADVADEGDFDQLGIGNFDVVVVAIGNDFESALLATMMAKEKGAGTVIAKANGQRQKKLLEGIGADRVVQPEIEFGEKIALNLIASNIIDYFTLADDYHIAEMLPKPAWVGKSLQQANIRNSNNLNVIAIKRGTDILLSPKAGEIIGAQDIVVVLGDAQSIEEATH